MIRKLSKIVLLSLIVCGFPLTSFAAGFEISPARYETYAEPGETIENVLKIKNKGEDTKVTFTVRDFTFKDETGTPLILEEGVDITKYSLSNWIIIPEDVAIEKEQEKEVPLVIHIPKDASPGGHYGTLFVQQKSDDLGVGKVSAVTKVGALIILRIEGEIIEQGSIESFDVPDELRSDDKITFVTRFKNTGNVHLAPKGKIYINDAKGERVKDIGMINEINELGIVTGTSKVDYIPFNRDGFLVLPDQTRRYEISYKTGNLSGAYTANLELMYGAKNETVHSVQTVSFVVIGKDTEEEKKVGVAATVEGETENIYLYIILVGALLVVLIVFISIRKRKKLRK